MAPLSSTSEKPWHQHLTLDLLLHVFSKSIFHPFVAWMIPLCLRAQATPYTAPSFVYTTAYASFLTLLYFLSILNQRIAYGIPREIDLTDEVIVITGGASGLGLCIAEIYGMRGASVAVMDVKEVDERTRAEGVEFYTCDVGDREQVDRIWAQIVDDLGTPTVLINNAAILHGKRFLDLTPEEVEASFRINTLSHYHLTKRFLPPLINRPEGGHLITISSVLAHLGASHLSAYTATKAALLAFHSSLTAELALPPPQGNPAIKTLLVTPGQLSTELFTGVESSALSRFVGPTVEVKDLAMKIVGKIDKGEGGMITEPAYARWIGVLELLPTGLQKVARRVSGVDVAMDGWVMKRRGHTKSNGKKED